MPKIKFTQDQIDEILKEHQAGLSTIQVCRKYGISNGTFYNWRFKFSELHVSDTHRLKTLEDENQKLRELLVESMVDNVTLKETA